MSASRKQAERDSFRAVKETCPEVDDALADACRRIKGETGALRDALIDAIQRANEAEEEIESLRSQIEDLRAQVAELSGVFEA